MSATCFQCCPGKSLNTIVAETLPMKTHGHLPQRVKTKKLKKFTWDFNQRRKQKKLYPLPPNNAWLRGPNTAHKAVFMVCVALRGEELVMWRGVGHQPGEPLARSGGLKQAVLVRFMTSMLLCERVHISTLDKQVKKQTKGTVRVAWSEFLHVCCIRPAHLTLTGWHGVEILRNLLQCCNSGFFLWMCNIVS